MSIAPEPVPIPPIVIQEPLSWRRKFRTLITWILAIAPIVLVAILVRRCAIDVPFWDQWDIAPIFGKAHDHTLSWDDLIAQHNESRKVFPRLLFIGLASQGGWDVRREIATSFVLLIIVSLCTVYLGWRTTVSSDRDGRRRENLLRLPLLWLLANLAIFSPTQHENLAWGIQVVVFLPVALLMIGLAIAETRWRTSLRYGLVILIAIIATFSYANGMLLWPLLFPALLFGGRPSKNTWKIWPIYIFIAVAAIGYYFHGYVKPAWHPEFNEGSKHPLAAVQYFFAFLGAPLGWSGQNVKATSITFGVILFLMTAYAGFYVLLNWRDRNLWRRATPWICLAGYAIASAVVTTAGRLGLGVEQALASRYTSFAVYQIVALVFLIPIIADHCRLKRNPLQTLRPSAAGGFLAGALLVPCLLSSWFGAQVMLDTRVNRLHGKAAVEFVNVLGDEQVIATGILNRPDVVGPRAKMLDDMKYLSPALIKSADVSEFDGTIEGEWYGNLDAFDRQPDGKWLAAGWGALPTRNEPADAILLAYSKPDGHWTVFAMGIEFAARADVVTALNKRGFEISGWQMSFPADRIPADAKSVSAWSFDSLSGKAYRLAGERDLPGAAIPSTAPIAPATPEPTPPAATNPATSPAH